MRLHAPRPELVIVWLCGVCRAGVDVLLELHRAATARGTQLHITGGLQAAWARILQRLHHDRPLCLSGSTDAVIALLPRVERCG